MQGSTYPIRSKICRDECGDGKTCAARRAKHVTFGAVVNTHKSGNGRWVQRRKQGFATRKEAEQWIVSILGEVANGRVLTPEQRKITTGTWLDMWLASRVNLRPASVRSYRLICRDYLKPWLGRVPLSELRPEHVDSLLARMRDGRLRPAENRRRADGMLSTRTINHVFGVLRTALNAAVKRRLLTWNPCSAVELETAERHEASTWGPAEADAFLAHCESDGPAWAPIAYRLALRFGLRRGELCALRWEDIGAETLSVRRNAVAVGMEVVIGEPKSHMGERSIPLAADPGMAAALRATRKRQLAERLASGEAWQETGLIVAGEHGAMVPPWLASEMFRKLAQAAGLPVIRLHEARHSAGSTWLEAGLDFKTIQLWLGHATLAVTTDIYLHVRPVAHDAAAAKVAAFLNAQSAAR